MLARSLLKIALVFELAALVLSIVVVLRPAEASATPTVWVDPSSVVYTVNDVEVGDWFTVDVRVSCVEPWALMMFQAYIKYNKNYLSPSNMSTYVWSYPTTRLNVTPPESWSPSYVFFGASGTIGNPAIMQADSTYNAIMCGETLMNDVSLLANQTYLLARFNFTIIALPGKYEDFATPLQINSSQTFMYNLAGRVLEGPDPNIIDGHYEVDWIVPAPANLNVVRADGSPWPLLFPGYENATGKAFDVRVYLYVDVDWNLTNATLALNYNQTLVEIVGGAANVTVDPFWSEPVVTFETGKVTVFVKAPTAPGPVTPIATMKFTVMYQGVNPDVDSTDLTSSDVVLWDHKMQVPQATHGYGRVAIYGVGTDHDIALVSVTTSKAIAGQGYPVGINVNVTNQGDFAETFNVTVEVNATNVGTAQVTLMNGSSTVVTFAWNTGPFAYGNYTVSAFAEPVLGEVYTVDNNMTDGTVQIGIPGDVDGNHRVNMLDLYNIALNFGKSAPYASPQIANCDIDDNGMINMLDLYVAALHFGQSES
jgi:hypothetical protein